MLPVTFWLQKLLHWTHVATTRFTWKISLLAPVGSQSLLNPLTFRCALLWECIGFTDAPVFHFITIKHTWKVLVDLFSHHTKVKFSLFDPVWNNSKTLGCCPIMILETTSLAHQLHFKLVECCTQDPPVENVLYFSSKRGKVSVFCYTVLCMSKNIETGWMEKLEHI